MRVSIKNAQKRFGGAQGHQALANISLVAKDGELLVLLGPSGSGKTTLLRAIAGLELLDGGTISFGERRVNDLDPAERGVGMVFQDYALYPHLSVWENIAYSMKIRRLPRQEIDRRVREAAEMLRIAPYLDRKPAQLSGGQRQRVAVARAMTRDAEVLLMDEPLSNLDAQIREHVRVELRELQRRLGVTTIYVTHDQVEAMVLADRIAVMSEGRIEQLGTPDEIYNRPATLFCARFVGSPKINEIRGTVVQNGGRACFVIDPATNLALDLEIEEGRTVSPDAETILAFRAEDARVEERGIEADLSLIENRGAEKFAVAMLPPVLKEIQASPDIRILLPRRETVGGKFAFVPTYSHLFESGSGHRLAGARCRGIVSDEGQWKPYLTLVARSGH
jgi:sn-glycerol 3-phosphate transport system ATP-binding protein